MNSRIVGEVMLAPAYFRDSIEAGMTFHSIDLIQRLNVALRVCLRLPLVGKQLLGAVLSDGD